MVAIDRRWCRLANALAVAMVLGGAARAQDDVLAVERREDLRQRDAVAAVLRATRADFHVDGASPRDFCRLLSTRLGDQLSFSVAAKAEELAGRTVSLELRGVSLWSAMAIVQEQIDLRFVFRTGVVFLVPKDAIKPLTYVVVYDLRPQCARLHNFPGPELRLPGGGDEGLQFPPEEESTETVSGWTADGIEALLREHVTPDQWGTAAASLANTNGLFVVRHSPAGHRQVRELLAELGLIAPPRVRPLPPPSESGAPPVQRPPVRRR